MKNNELFQINHIRKCFEFQFTLFLIIFSFTRKHMPYKTYLIILFIGFIISNTLSDTLINTYRDSGDSIINCNCSEYIPKSFSKTDKCLFPAYGSIYCFKNKPNSDNKSTFECLARDSIRLKTNILCFNGYDSIPQKFGIFKNVEIVMLDNCRTTKGLDVFPKLKSVRFYTCRLLNINDDEKWLRAIEEIRIYKSLINGPVSFSSMPNLKILYLEYSGFKRFPNDIYMLQCLQDLCLWHYSSISYDTIPEFKVSSINRSEFPCLKSECAP